MDKVVGEVNSLSKYLQSSNILFTEAADLTRSTMTTLRDMRSSEFFEERWHESEEIATDASIVIPMDD